MGRKDRLKRWSTVSEVVVMLVTDPSFAFLFPTLFLPLFVHGDVTTKVLRFSVPDLDVLQEYFTNYAFLACVGFFVLAQILTIGGSSSRTANWFLLNGCIIHVAMDGLTGGFHALPALDNAYRQLDNRFNYPDPTGSSEDAYAAAKVVVSLELFLMAPMCLITYYGCLRKRIWSNEMVMLTAFLRLIGTIVFIVPEFITGCKNLSPFGLESCETRFKTVPEGTTLYYHMLYFGFAVGANIVWIVVPAKLMLDAWCSNCALKRAAKAKVL